MRTTKSDILTTKEGKYFDEKFNIKLDENEADLYQNCAIVSTSMLSDIVGINLYFASKAKHNTLEINPLYLREPLAILS